MPPVATLEALRRAVAAFPAWELDLLIEPTALAAAQQSLSISGLLLVGEVHGVRENPLILDALMAAFRLDRPGSARAAHHPPGPWREAIALTVRGRVMS
jgi:hypothetical protein